MGHVRVVLQHVLENRLYVKAEKYEFHSVKTTFLGGIGGVETLARGGRTTTCGLDRPSQPRVHHNLRLNAGQSCCALFVARFNFLLSCRLGAQNAKPDALLRQFEEKASKREDKEEPILQEMVLGALSCCCFEDKGWSHQILVI